MVSDNSLYFLHIVIGLFALYCSFKRNHGLEIGSFLMALIFPEIYVVYYFATGGTIN